MVSRWRSSKTPDGLAFVSFNRNQNLFHSKLVDVTGRPWLRELERIHNNPIWLTSGLPSVIRTQDVNRIPAIIGEEIVKMSTKNTEFNNFAVVHNQNSYVVTMYGVRTDVPFRCERANECATPEDIFIDCASHEHFVIGNGALRLTQMTECARGNNVKTFSVITEVASPPDVLPDEQTIELEYNPWSLSDHVGMPVIITREPSPVDYWYDFAFAKENDRDSVRWRSAPWNTVDRSSLSRLNSPKWEFFRASQNRWEPLHTDPSVLQTIETGFADGRRQLPYNSMYSPPTPNGHMFMIDYELMVQFDVDFPVDPRRTSKIRRRVSRADNPV
jgi:hypothetical protein